MEGFTWAENNLDVRTPEELESQGVSVSVAPNVSPSTRVVNLADGRVELFQPGEERPERGYYVEVSQLERYCRDRGRPLLETNGQMSLAPAA